MNDPAAGFAVMNWGVRFTSVADRVRNPQKLAQSEPCQARSVDFKPLMVSAGSRTSTTCRHTEGVLCRPYRILPSPSLGWAASSRTLTIPRHFGPTCSRVTVRYGLFRQEPTPGTVMPALPRNRAMYSRIRLGPSFRSTRSIGASSRSRRSTHRRSIRCTCTSSRQGRRLWKR